MVLESFFRARVIGRGRTSNFPLRSTSIKFKPPYAAAIWSWIPMLSLSSFCSR
jgi:hypothetical protein